MFFSFFFWFIIEQPCVLQPRCVQNQFQVRVVGVAVDQRLHPQCKGARAGAEEAASQGHFQISLVGLSCGREAS